MNEVRQNWSSFKTSRSSIVVSGNSTWYDVPAPVIVHNRQFIEEDEVVYQNDIEVKLNSLNKEQQQQNGNKKKRHSSSIELTAATSVKTDADGVPTITFSFLRSDEAAAGGGASRLHRLEIDETDEVDSGVAHEHLYDFPRNSRSDSSVTKAIEDCQPAVDDRLHQSSETQELEPETNQAAIPGVACNSSLVRLAESSSSNKAIGGWKGPRKSLKWRRSLGKIEDLVRPALGQSAGSHSDSEAVPSGAPGAGGRGWPSRRRLGKAWGRMRSWLSEERSKLGEVVARHARAQAVGARFDDVTEESTSASGRSGFYDLSRARLQLQDAESRQLPRIEEFGLMDERAYHLHPALIKKTASSDDILAEKTARERLPPATSYSLERLCSEDELLSKLDDAAVDSPDADKNEGAIDKTSHQQRRRRFARGELIKRRMLGSIRGLIASSHLLHEPAIEESGPGGFEEVRRYVKQGGDFCKELAAILHERAELEANYAKGLSKLSGKLTKACAKDQGGNGSGGVSEAWRCVGEEMEAAAEAHRAWGIALGEQLAKPLRVGVAEVQGRTRKSIENSVDKASKSLQEWRTVAAKTKKQSFACARENERLQDMARLQSISQTHQQHQQQQQQQHHQHQHQHQSNNKLASNGHHMTEKEVSKLETRRRKAEDSARRADTEFYTVTVRAERARLEYECAVRKAAKQMELLEEERLSALKDLANVYLAHLQALAPKLQQSADRLSQPIRNCSVSQDVEILKNLIRRIDSNDSSSTEQLLPDFYAEHVTLAMNRERRKQALVRVLHLIRQDLERERRGREGLETLHRAFIKTPAFAADESTQNVTDKLLHMRSMLTYLEAARYKVGGALSELEGGKRDKHPLAEHILVSRDKQGLQQSVLKVPSWAKNESFEFQDSSEGELEVLQLSKDSESEQRDWADRTAGDGNSENPPDEEDFSDFDEFSSNSEDNNQQDVDSADVSSVAGKTDDGIERCRAIYQYTANLNDELSLTPGDLITVHEKQADGWWIGECRGRTGIFPATYVQVIN